MKYMVVHEELKAGGWRTTVPDLPRCSAKGVKSETRIRSAERSIRKHIALLAKANKPLPNDKARTVHLKRTVKRCVIHFVQIAPLNDPELTGAL